MTSQDIAEEAEAQTVEPMTEVAKESANEEDAPGTGFVDGTSAPGVSQQAREVLASLSSRLSGGSGAAQRRGQAMLREASARTTPKQRWMGLAAALGVVVASVIMLRTRRKR